MDRMPELSELGNSEGLVIEFEEVDCLLGPSRWVLEIRGGDPSLLRIATTGRGSGATKLRSWVTNKDT